MALPILKELGDRCSVWLSQLGGKTPKWLRAVPLPGLTPKNKATIKKRRNLSRGPWNSQPALLHILPAGKNLLLPTTFLHLSYPFSQKQPPLNFLPISPPFKTLGSGVSNRKQSQTIVNKPIVSRANKGSKAGCKRKL